MPETSTRDDVFDDSYKAKEGPKPPMRLVWRNIILMFLLHVGALYGLMLVPSASALTLAWSKYHHLLNVPFYSNVLVPLVSVLTPFSSLKLLVYAAWFIWSTSDKRMCWAGWCICEVGVWWCYTDMLLLARPPIRIVLNVGTPTQYFPHGNNKQGPIWWLLSYYIICSLTVYGPSIFNWRHCS